jgi:hypothetical protein
LECHRSRCPGAWSLSCDSRCFVGGPSVTGFSLRFLPIWQKANSGAFLWDAKEPTDRSARLKQISRDSSRPSQDYSASRTLFAELMSPPPILFCFPLHCRGVWILSLDPMKRAAGIARRIATLRQNALKPTLQACAATQITCPTTTSLPFPIAS